MKDQFVLNYPGEEFDKDCQRGERLLAEVFRMYVSGKYEWLPWSLYLSINMEIEFLRHRAAKAGLTTIVGLNMQDTPPHLEDNELRPNPCAIKVLLTNLRNAFAMCGCMHLKNLKALGKRFMNTYEIKYGEHKGRPLTLIEAIEVHRNTWEAICTLINEEGWEPDQDVFEFSRVRSDVDNMVAIKRLTIPKGNGQSKSFRLSLFWPRFRRALLASRPGPDLVFVP